MNIVRPNWPMNPRSSVDIFSVNWNQKKSKKNLLVISCKFQALGWHTSWVYAKSRYKRVIVDLQTSEAFRKITHGQMECWHTIKMWANPLLYFSTRKAVKFPALIWTRFLSQLVVDRFRVFWFLHREYVLPLPAWSGILEIIRAISLHFGRTKKSITSGLSKSLFTTTNCSICWIIHLEKNPMIPIFEMWQLRRSIQRNN